MRANVYVDGFNLYHGAVKDRPACKWLDLNALSCALLPKDEIHRIRYFTARVGGSAADPHQPERQNVYLRALSGLTNYVCHEGQFQTETDVRPLAGSPPENPVMVKVRLPEEKGSDVNLATYLMLDACDEEEMEVALVISDDFDLKEPLQLVRDRFGIVLGVASPRNRRHLANDVGADFYKTIRESLLLACQFPDTTYDEEFLEVQRPSAWS